MATVSLAPFPHNCPLCIAPRWRPPGINTSLGMIKSPTLEMDKPSCSLLYRCPRVTVWCEPGAGHGPVGAGCTDQAAGGWSLGGRVGQITPIKCHGRSGTAIPALDKGPHTHIWSLANCLDHLCCNSVRVSPGAMFTGG